MSRTLQTLMLVMAAWLWSAPALATSPEAAPSPAVTAEDAKAPAAETGSDDAKAPDADAKAEDAKADDAAETDTEGAPPEIESDEEAVAAAEDLYKAINSGQWPLAVGLGLMLLVFAVRKFVPGDKLAALGPWIAALLGTAGYVAVALMNDPAGDWMDAATKGLMAGAAAVGFWEMLGKRFLKKSA